MLLSGLNAGWRNVNKRAGEAGFGWGEAPRCCRRTDGGSPPSGTPAAVRDGEQGGAPSAVAEMFEKDRGSVRIGPNPTFSGKILPRALKKTSPSRVRSARGSRERRREPLGVVERTRKQKVMWSAGARGGRSPPEIPTLANQLHRGPFLPARRGFTEMPVVPTDHQIKQTLISPPPSLPPSQTPVIYWNQMHFVPQEFPSGEGRATSIATREVTVRLPLNLCFFRL